MAYLIELEDENAESDIPTTVLRSKADCPGLESLATLSTNDIVINKLTQILSYLRQGKAGKKIKKAKETKDMPPPNIIPGLKVNKSVVVEDSIYGNIGTYVAPMKEKSSSSNSRDRRNDKRDYFDDKSRKDKDDDDNRDKSKDAKSAAVLEAERTLGALLKPAPSDSSVTNYFTISFSVIRKHQKIFNLRNAKEELLKRLIKFFRNCLLNLKDMPNAIPALKKWMTLLKILTMKLITLKWIW